MFEFLRNHQVDIMLALTSICVMLAGFTLITKTLPKLRKRALLGMEICAAIWLEADRIAYLYHGIPGVFGYWVVRFSNFAVFMMTIVVLYSVNQYIEDVVVNECQLPKIPVSLRISDLLAGIAAVLVVISQFTGLYYTFDESNTYQRSGLYFISYVFPYLMLLLQLWTIVYHRKKMKGKLALSIFLFDIICLVSSLIQLFAYGVSLVDMSAVAMVILLYTFALIDMNEKVDRANQIEISHLKGEQASMKRLFEQTARALATAIDAKDQYTRGHSGRVADYAKEIARRAGKSEKTCDEVYYAALLHDVGKLGIADEIIRKETSLSEEEYDTIKEHPRIGGEILSAIDEFPFLEVGAKYHHERYDGKGYPTGLAGENIPDIARIVAVADTYDSMTSKRSYRDPLPQETVKEEIVKGAGTQFDPEYAKIMTDMILQDTDYLMKEQDDSEGSNEGLDLARIGEIQFREYEERIADGVRVTGRPVKIRMSVQPDKGHDPKMSIPAFVLFDSYDGCVHLDDRGIRVLRYTEYGELWFDGHFICTAARDMKVDIREKEQKSESTPEDTTVYDITAAKYKDHVRILIDSPEREIDVIVALPDSVRYFYMGLTGEHCRVSDITLQENIKEVDETYIPRIVEEVNYIDKLEGDLPNVQVEGYRMATSLAVPVADGMRLIFRTQSLPTAHLIWHCPFLYLFTSDDGTPEGSNLREYACIRLDGEDATIQDRKENELTVVRDEGFEGWDAWKELNKKGYLCEVRFKRRRNKITMFTENAGISLKNVTTLPDKYGEVFVALTGDQCALTDIRVL